MKCNVILITDKKSIPKSTQKIADFYMKIAAFTLEMVE